MDIFVYIYDRMEVGRDELEDALDDAFVGVGEVTGGGGGEMCSNIDIEVSDDISRDDAIKLVRKALEPFNMPSSTKVVIDGETIPF